MSRPAALLVLPTRDREDEPIDAAVLAKQCLEDLRLAERVARALGATGYPSLRRIEVSVGNRLAFLQGQVPSYYMKQVAQAVALNVPGVQELRNELEVVGFH
jgi:osmotically-inducible protein OsmY